jgi:hypothetical protein
MNWLFYIPFGIIAFLSAVAGRRRNFVIVQVLVVACVLALLAGTRYGDNDYANYGEIFYQVPELADFSLDAVSEIHGETGFLFLASTAKTIGLSFQSFLMIIAIASVGLVGAATWRLSYFPLVSMLLYYSHVFLLREMMQIRAGLAVAVVLIFFSFTEGFLKRFVGILFASLFHGGALIILPFYVFVHVVKYRWRLFLLVFLIAMAFSVVGVAKPLTELLASMGILPSAVAQYVEWEGYNARINALLSPVTWKAFFVLYSLKAVTDEELGRTLAVIRGIYACGLIVFLSFSDFAILAGRLSTFLFFGESVLLAWALFYKRDKRYGFALCLLIAFMQLTLNLYMNEIHEEYNLYFLAV